MSSAELAGMVLWEKEGALKSIMFPYVRNHANAMMARIRQEDPRAHYVALQEVNEVCLYKRINQNQEILVPSAAPPVAASLSSSFSSMAPFSRRDVSITRDQMDSTHCKPEEFEFRGITHVPGTVDTVIDFLASESARENYWVALNTLRDVKAAALLSSARLQPQSLSASSVTSNTEIDITAFPRWSRKYMAAQFSKHNTHVLDCCYAEYATCCIETNNRGHSRLRGFVYRRSVSERALSSTSSVSSEPLAKARVQGAARFYIRDWLFDVVETQEPLVCKLVLTCTMLIPQTMGRGGFMFRSAFREFCTELMVGTRRALTHQWKDHAAHAGVRSSSAWRRETRCCSVCSAQFSLLRKRYICRSCGSGMCSKCCLKTTPAPDRLRSEFSSSVVSGAKMQQRGSDNRECLLCAKFGLNSELNISCARQTSSKGRHLSTSISSMSASISRGFAVSSRGVGAILDLEQEEVDQAHPDLELRSTTSISGSRGQRSQQSIGSISSQRSISGPDDDDEESDEDARPCCSRVDLRAANSKLRAKSAESSRSSHSAPSIVLLSDLDALTLSGSFHRTASVSARSSASFAASLSTRSPANGRKPAKSAAPTLTAPRAQQSLQRQDRAVSADDFLLTAAKPRVGTREGSQESSASTEEDEEVYSEDDLANFTLKLLPTTQ
ncbi:unnamed protein product [Peronospora belbahrii]|uniref:Protrudin n=1 Tax=Peronospora belbahrii TaxID=622444 RepID=A0AAU9LIQ2_9STRA|nr:unnamed protein product [Peronospora belbahrii]